MLNHKLPFLSVVFVGCLLVASCSGSQDSAESTSSTESSAETSQTSTTEASTTSTTSTKAPAAPVIEGSPAAVRDVVIAWFNGESELDEETYETLFADIFRDQVPFAEFTPIIDQLQQVAPWELDEVLGETETDGAYRLRDSTGGLFVLNVSIDQSQLVSGLNIVPWTEPTGSFEEAQQQLKEYETSTLLVAETTSGECVPVSETNADQIQPLGSVFKLYVLAALLDAVDEGTVTWTQNVTIRDELDSFPSGTTQDVEAGTEMTVLELAELMISISDNTATDHLIDLLGRETVEEAQAAYGHSDPDLNRPFLTTRELFLLKTDESLLAEYVDADSDQRRALLDSMANLDLPPIEDVLSFVEGGALAVDVAEWFATPNDMCRLLVELAKSSEVKDILAINPGVPDDTGRWSYIGFKGGSEPGVVASAWLLEDADGRTFTVTGGITSDGTESADSVVSTFVGIRDFFEAPAS